MAARARSTVNGPVACGRGDAVSFPRKERRSTPPPRSDGQGEQKRSQIMKFTKMHGIGNDYVYVNTFDQKAPPDPARLARAITDRHFGVGGDGLILIGPSERAD